MLKRINRIISFALTVTVLISCFAGCSDKGIMRVSNKYKASKKVAVKSGVIAQNDNYQLLWDKGYSAVFLVERNKENIWSSIPYDYYMNGSFEGVAGVRLDSVLELEYYDSTDMQLKTVYSSVEAKKNGNISSSVKKGVLTVVYDFTYLEISIPVEFSLLKNGIKATIRVDKIKEGENQIYSIGLLPFMASVKATADKSSYLVVPSGSGALMFLDENKREARNINIPIYGEDYSVTTVEKSVYTESVTMPFFGVKDTDRALMGVVTAGSELAAIKAQAGDSDIGYGSVYAAFTLRGKDTSYVPASSGYKEAVVKYTDEMALVDKLQVSYFPLSQDDANYVGMANFYSKNFLKFNKNNTEKELYLQFYGATKVEKSFLGVPYKSLEAITTVSRVGEITKELSEYSAGTAVQLIGFGKSGLDIGSICGGYKISSKLGGMKQYLKLQKDLDKNGISSYLDFDVLNFTKSGNGIKEYNGCAYTANGLNVTRNFYGYSTPSIAPGSYSYHLVRRDKLSDIFSKLLKKCDDVKGYSLKSVGDTVYSDYRSQDTYLRANYISQVEKLLKSAKKEHNMAFSKPNYYALKYANDIFGIPTKTSEYYGFDETVPLYAIALKGKVGFSVSAINTKNDVNKEYLKAAEVGAGLGFALSDNWIKEYITSFHTVLGSTAVKDWSGYINKLSQEYKPYFEAVKGAHIVSHETLETDVVRTVFDNGVYVIVNYSQSDFDAVESGSYTWGRKVGAS